MDDVSKIQQINSVARELMKHGQANSMEEATRMATLQIESGAVATPQPEGGMPASPMPEAPAPGEPVSQVTQPAEPTVEPAAEVPVPQDMPQQQEGMNMEDMFRQLEKVVSGQQSILSSMTNAVNAHTKQLEDMNNKMNGLIAEIASVKEGMQKMKENPVVAPPLKPKDTREGQTQFKDSSPAPQPTPAPEKKPDGSGHARSGNYKPDDVSIEKMFYYGGR